MDKKRVRGFPSRFSEADVERMRQLCFEGRLLKEIALEYSCCISHVCRLTNYGLGNTRGTSKQKTGQ